LLRLYTFTKACSLKPTEYLLYVFISNLKFYFFLKFEATTILKQGVTFKVSKVIEACKRFGRGCKPRPASALK
jgi:hypothetical protein